MSELLADLDRRLRAAIVTFWSTQTRQSKRQGAKNGAGRRGKDRGNRAAVTGGKHLDGFIGLVEEILCAAGVQRATIYRRTKTELPGWFRAEKNWDLLVVADGRVVAVIEFKSQVGSFGNNFNNRAEEVLGNATDLWAAYEEGAFRPSERPWLGYLMLLEDAPEATRAVGVREPHFPVFPEFEAASYADRYYQLLTRVIRRRLYDAGCLLMSSRQGGLSGEYREPSAELGFRPFVASLLGRAVAVAQTQPPGPPAPPQIEVGPAPDVPPAEGV